MMRERRGTVSKNILTGDILKSGPVLVGMTGLSWPAIRRLILTTDGIRLLNQDGKLRREFRHGDIKDLRIDRKRAKVIRIEVDLPKSGSTILPSGQKPRVYKWEVGSPEVAAEWIDAIRDARARALGFNDYTDEPASRQSRSATLPVRKLSSTILPGTVTQKKYHPIGVGADDGDGDDYDEEEEVDNNDDDLSDDEVEQMRSGRQHQHQHHQQQPQQHFEGRRAAGTVSVVAPRQARKVNEDSFWDDMNQMNGGRKRSSSFNQPTQQQQPQQLQQQPPQPQQPPQKNLLLDLDWPAPTPAVPAHGYTMPTISAPPTTMYTSTNPFEPFAQQPPQTQQPRTSMQQQQPPRTQQQPQQQQPQQQQQQQQQVFGHQDWLLAQQKQQQLFLQQQQALLQQQLLQQQQLQQQFAHLFPTGAPTGLTQPQLATSLTAPTTSTSTATPSTLGMPSLAPPPSATSPRPLAGTTATSTLSPPTTQTDSSLLPFNPTWAQPSSSNAWMYQ